MAKKSKKNKGKEKGKKKGKAGKREEIVLDERLIPDLPDEIPPRMAERFAAGKEVREAVPIADHAGWTAPADRPDPVAILQQQAERVLQKGRYTKEELLKEVRDSVETFMNRRSRSAPPFPHPENNKTGGKRP